MHAELAELCARQPLQRGIKPAARTRGLRKQGGAQTEVVGCNRRALRRQALDTAARYAVSQCPSHLRALNLPPRRVER